MNFVKKLALVIAAVTIFSFVVAVADEYAYSTVYFNIPVNLQFSVTMRGSTANLSSPAFPGTATEDIYFNTTGTNDKYVDACRMGYADATNCQDATNPVLLFINTGNVNMNLTIVNGGSTALNSTYLIMANSSNVTSKNVGCSGMAVSSFLVDANLTTTATNFVTGLCPNNQTNLFLHANFTNAPVGLSPAYYLNYTSNRAP